MTRVRLLLVTAPIEACERRKRLARLRKTGTKLGLLGELASPDQGTRLTPRQTQVLRGMALGYRTKEIARQLGISGKTVETYRQQLTKRLGLTHAPGFVRYAIQTGVVPGSWHFMPPTKENRK